MNTLGSDTTNIFYKSEGEQLSHAFAVADRRAILSFSADFVASNSTALSVNGVSITPVVYATSHAATFAALVAAIDGLSSVESATGNSTTRLITIIPTDQTIDPVIVAATTGGAGQPTITKETGNDLYPACPVVLDTDGSIRRFSVLADTQNTQVIGYAIMAGAAGEIVTVKLHGDNVIEALAADAIVPGPVAFSSYDSTTGKIKFTDGSVTITNMMGWAIDTADADGDEIKVILR